MDPLSRLSWRVLERLLLDAYEGSIKVVGLTSRGGAYSPAVPVLLSPSLGTRGGRNYQEWFLCNSVR
eukprot:8822434-Pyramimonas_sp.AAC.1